mmetsp:Transcript_60744/g.162587  ORF Transcript_60744/g.162587 Transcript_60744/m.162587 type:complete len:234 (+) Transcript_60744:1909-2610(+)
MARPEDRHGIVQVPGVTKALDQRGKLRVAGRTRQLLQNVSPPLPQGSLSNDAPSAQIRQHAAGAGHVRAVDAEDGRLRVLVMQRPFRHCLQQSRADLRSKHVWQSLYDKLANRFVGMDGAEVQGCQDRLLAHAAPVANVSEDPYHILGSTCCTNEHCGGPVGQPNVMSTSKLLQLLEDRNAPLLRQPLAILHDCNLQDGSREETTSGKLMQELLQCVLLNGGLHELLDDLMWH